MKPCVVLVHIGNFFYEYLNICIDQIRRFNECDIFLVISEKHFEKITSDIRLISIEKIKKSKEHFSFLKNNRLDSHFRNGFWKSTTERFFYLDAVIQFYNLKNVFHFENDIMIYCELSQILKTCVNNNFKMAATFDNDKRCIPGFIYFESSEILSQLNKFILQNETKNDMELIAEFNNKYKKIDFFPIAPDNYKFNFLSRLKTKHQKKYKEHYKIFNSIFDAAAIGQYLGGIDPRNSTENDTKGFINESALYKASSFKYDWEIDEKGRKIPIAEYKGEKIKINNLHIHSKDLKQFQ